MSCVKQSILNNARSYFVWTLILATTTKTVMYKGADMVIFGYSFYLWSSVFFYQAFSEGYETNKSDKSHIKPQTIGNSFYHILLQPSET